MLVNLGDMLDYRFTLLFHTLANLLLYYIVIFGHLLYLALLVIYIILL